MHEYNNITNIEIDSNMFKKEDDHLVLKNRLKSQSKRMANTQSIFGHKTDSAKNQKKVNMMIQDYDYVPRKDNKRRSPNTREIISIYENDESLRSVPDVLNVKRRIKCGRKSTQPHLMSNKFLIGVQNK
jgi:hypothetical protein